MRFIAKQNSLMKIGNNSNLVLGPFDESTPCVMIVLMSCQTKLRINHLTAVKSIYILQKVVVELECLNSHFAKHTICDRRNSASTRNLLLKGQMRLIEEWDAIIYLCVPLLSNLQEMQEVGLYLTDLCLHDSSREIVLAGWQHGARLEISYEKVS
ncbi:soluble guanylate cyclase 89Db [Trichonephila clavipes]|uniref:guanylate cyclase n=1 Tax=Trichonephila clavipes TaxID=2585209 RepID=A0A8X6W9H9_TRICX|nr:soluble guanylate cyclase 89Db [Trichonephila clavipes]